MRTGDRRTDDEREPRAQPPVASGRVAAPAPLPSERGFAPRRALVELAFMLAYVRANWKVALEYRFAFWANVLAMALNDLMWVAFWAVFFARFPNVRGYDLRDVLTMWAIAALGFGLATGVFGNSHRFAEIVAAGGLDFYLLLPRPVLLHLLISRMSVSAWGDALFGLGLYTAVVRPSPGELVAFVCVSMAAGALFTGYYVIVSSLAFWLGQAEGLVFQVFNAMIMFSTYPTTLFNGAVRVLLFTALPAGFIAYVPVRFLREWQPWQLAALLGAATAYTLVSVWVFRRGLSRYESGNLVSMRT